MTVFGQLDPGAQFDFVKHVSQLVIIKLLAPHLQNADKAGEFGFVKTAGKQTDANIFQNFEHVFRALHGAGSASRRVGHLLKRDQSVYSGNRLGFRALART